MWQILKADALPSGIPPEQWPAGVLPRRRETYERQYLQAQETLDRGAYDRRVSWFATDERGPAGISVITGEGTARRVAFLGVRGDLRRRGLGRALLERSVAAAREERVTRLTTSGVSSRNTEAMRLLASCGFRGQAEAGIRMRRSLVDIPPPGPIPRGLELRSLHPGEEAAWVEMKNACFREEGAKDWSVAGFHRAFTDHPVFDYDRVVVVMWGERVVASASAWEADYGEGPVGLLHWVCVLPSWRRKGLGSAVSVRAMSELAARGYVDAWLNTSWKRGAAVGLYTRLGFQVHREIVSYSLQLDA